MYTILLFKREIIKKNPSISPPPQKKKTLQYLSGQGYGPPPLKEFHVFNGFPISINPNAYIIVFFLYLHSTKYIKDSRCINA